MGLRVLGTAWGRTGTLSAKVALERLGLGPCYHMLEVFRVHPEHKEAWIDAARGVSVNWEHLFAGYQSAVDWPACVFWPELIEEYPDMQVVQVLRDPQRWYESYDATIRAGIPTTRPPSEDATDTMMYEVIFKRSFSRALGRSELIRAYEAHIERVRETVDPSRLLMWSLTEGWAPLCDFLDLPEPSEPIPHVNDREDFFRIFAQGENPI